MSKRSLAGIAGIVAAATLLSKVFGLVREQAIAAAFGTGPVADAYQIAYVIPGFFLILLGGVNGPFHSAIVSVVAKQKNQKDTELIIETVTTVVGIALLAVTVFIVAFAGDIIPVLGRGFSQTDIGLESQTIAIAQLRIMAPIAIFACFIGIGFGALNAADQYWLPSLSPLLSSSAVIVGVGILWLALEESISDPSNYLLCGAVLAGCTLIGAILQWLLQVPALWKSGLGRLRLRFNINNQGVRDVLKVLGPATFSSGAMQINVYTDLFFASFVPGTLSALGYANSLVQAPLGIVSNIILVPFLPIFSRLAAPEHWPELKSRIRQSLVLVALTMLPIGALIVTLSRPAVRVVYERGTFDEDAVQLVSSLLLAYGAGMFVYLARDVMVRVFYALGDGQTPFNISLANILTNAVLDYLFFNWMGPPGLVVATIGVNVVSLIAMTAILSRRLNGLPIGDWTKTIFTITGASAIAGISSWLTLGGIASIAGTTDGFLVNLLALSLSGGVGLLTFALLTIVLQIPEAGILAQRIRQKFGR